MMIMFVTFFIRIKHTFIYLTLTLIYVHNIYWSGLLLLDVCRYGAVRTPGMQRVIQVANISANDVFLDLGSGIQAAS